jgi:hypothetical protein
MKYKSNPDFRRHRFPVVSPGLELPSPHGSDHGLIEFLFCGLYKLNLVSGAVYPDH